MGMSAWYDGCCEKWCGCVSFDAREKIKCCSICLCLAGLVVAAVVLGVAYGVVNHVRVTVEDASLTRFALLASPATALAYNLSLTLTVQNMNWAMGVKYVEPLEAAYLFDGQRFDRVQLQDKGYEQPGSKTVVYHLSSGSEGAYTALGNAGAAAYRKANATGSFAVEVDLSGAVKYGPRTTKCKLAVSCPLQLQLAPPGTATVVFRKVKCTVAKPENKNC